MPHLSGLISDQGPIIDVMVGVSQPRREALTKAGQAVPQLVPARLLVDTGASHTVIDPNIINPLGIQPTGQVAFHTPSTNGVPSYCDVFDVALLIRAVDRPVYFAPAHPVMTNNMQAQGIDGLLGRDILAASRMTYSGADQFFMISF